MFDIKSATLCFGDALTGEVTALLLAASGITRSSLTRSSMHVRHKFDAIGVHDNASYFL